MKFFTTPNSKNIIATLCIVTIKISESTFLWSDFKLIYELRNDCFQKLDHYMLIQTSLKSNGIVNPRR